ncbi:DNA mismatch repair endonuclease MutL [Candidatus Falkowbacteria bacterium]|jgi:DNA mismatch repair protein MutL|nr:DNA mismatch repair endonuclease MutL [Candidatus Falkowbacteria bacterium]
MSIKILNQDLINQIAAGEVVERPASVVKELVENSIDAGAQNISIEIKNGGINLIKVSDDGAGMNREDAELSIKQHATSKLATTEDLYRINTMGFRGEALASISSVSQFKLITKDNESVAGTIVEIVHNDCNIREIGSPVGTSIEVADLFYNVPARQKYLKTAVTEFNHVVDLFLNFCLAYPEINWKLIHNDKPVYQFPVTDIKTRIADVLGEEVSKNLIEVNFHINEMTVKGVIGKPQIARHNRNLQFLFVNKRPVNEYIVAKKIKDAYSTLISKDLFPVYILNLSVNTDKVDVNVHPRKLEVRFSEPQIVYRTVYSAVSSSLDEHDLVKNISPTDKNFMPLGKVMQQKFSPTAEDKSKQNHFSSSSGNALSNQIMQFSKKILDHDAVSQGGLSDSPAAPGNIHSPFDSPTPSPSLQQTVETGMTENQEIIDFNILGQIQNSYILVEVWNGIRIYDQHAVSERLQYEKIKRQWRIGKLSSQKLLLPNNIELTVAEARALSDNKIVLERLGFEISELSGNTFAISAVPQFLINSDIKEVVLEITGGFTEDFVADDTISEPLNKIFNMMSCRSAIKFGDELSEDGMRALINDIERVEDNKAKYTCVHGRPCVIEHTFDDLRKMFHR